MIKKIDDKALRERFNPDGSLLRKHQLRMLEMLEYVDNVCKKHNIRYWLSSGTLLGAVRHAGFIPWDDDLDIEMLKEDYDRLIKILKKERSTLYAIQTYETDDNYVLPFAKLRDLHSFVVEPNTFTYKYSGCWIDIFPLEKNTRICLRFCAFLYYHIFSSYGLIKGRPKFLLPIYKFMLYKLLFPFLRCINNIFPLTRFFHTYGVGFLKPRYLSDIFPLKELSFEGKLFPAPVNVDNYLRGIYGEYMEIPPLDKIEVHNIEISIENNRGDKEPNN